MDFRLRCRKGRTYSELPTVCWQGNRRPIAQARLVWALRRSVEDALGGDDLLIESAEEEHLVLDPGTADGEPGEFVIQARLLGQRITVRILCVKPCFWKLFMEFRIELFSFP